jgi:hypothetical protein
VAAAAQRVDQDEARSTVEEKVDVDVAFRRTRIKSV